MGSLPQAKPERKEDSRAPAIPGGPPRTPPGDGGKSTPVTAFDEESGENSHRFPFFLPDGKTLIYRARGEPFPRWSDDGRELFFFSPRDEPSPAYGNYDVSGDRFLVETTVEGGGAAPLQLVLNWPALEK